MALPLLFAEFRKSPKAYIIFVGALLIRKMPKLQGLDDPISYHRGAKAGSPPEKQHFPAFIAAQGLHRRIVYEFQRMFERLFKAKANPTGCEITRFCDWTVVERG